MSSKRSRKDESLLDASVAGLEDLLSSRRKKGFLQREALPCGAPAQPRSEDVPTFEDVPTPLEARVDASVDDDEWENAPAALQAEESSDDEVTGEVPSSVAARTISVDVDVAKPTSLSVTKKPRVTQTRKRTPTDRAFSLFVHRAGLALLLHRSLVLDEAASSTELGAAVLSCLPLTCRLSSPLPQLDELLSVVASFSAVFSLSPQLKVQRTPHRAPPLLDAVQAALVHRRGNAAALSCLFGAMLRSVGVRCRTVHALIPPPVEPDAQSLEASKHVCAGTFALPDNQPRARGWSATAAAAPAGGRNSAAATRGAARGAGTAAAPACGDGVVDLTADSDEEGAAPGVGGAAAPAPRTSPLPLASPPPRASPPSGGASRASRRGDAELEAQLASACAASAAHALGRGAAPAPSAPPPLPPPPAGWGGRAWCARRGAVHSWVEVASPGVGGWVSVAPWERHASAAAWHVVAEAAAMAGAAPPGGQLPHLPCAVACCGGGACDVTWCASPAHPGLADARARRRYARSLSSSAARVDLAWWAPALAPFAARERDARGGWGAKQEAAARADAVAREPPPTTLKGVRGHPRFCVERELRKYQVLWPRTPCGCVGDVPFFPRASICDVHTDGVWRRDHGRAVKAGELGSPAKRVLPWGGAAQKKREAAAVKAMHAAAAEGATPPARETSKKKGKGKRAAAREPDWESGGEGEEKAEEEEDAGEAALPGDSDPDARVRLYGLWQTEVYAPAAASAHSAIAVNEHGNVDLSKGNAPPPGCVWLREFPHIGAVAKRLGIDAPPAFVGVRRPRAPPGLFR